MRLLASIFLLAATLSAADHAGTWTGTATMKVEGETRTLPVNLVLKTTGDKIEGTVIAGDEEHLSPILAVRAEGAKLYFEVKDTSDDGPVLIKVNLERSGDELKGTYTRESGGRTTGGDVSLTKKQ